MQETTIQGITLPWDKVIDFITPLILDFLKNNLADFLKRLLMEEQHATRNGYDGPITAFFKSHERCCKDVT